MKHESALREFCVEMMLEGANPPAVHEALKGKFPVPLPTLHTIRRWREGIGLKPEGRRGNEHNPIIRKAAENIMASGERSSTTILNILMKQFPGRDMPSRSAIYRWRYEFEWRMNGHKLPPNREKSFVPANSKIHPCDDPVVREIFPAGCKQRQSALQKITAKQGYPHPSLKYCHGCERRNRNGDKQSG